MQSLKVVPGQKVTANEVAIDGVTSHFVLYTRIRALLSSFAYVCILTPEWFSLQDCDDTMEFLWDQMFVKVADSERPPPSYYNDAYFATMQVWQSHILTHKGNLSSAVRQRSMWMHHWMVRPVHQAGSSEF